MSLDMLQACVAGYSDRLLDHQILAVMTGYWSGYYNNAKHPTKLSKIIASIYKNHKKSTSQGVSKPKVDVDVDAFLEREKKFRQKLKEGGSVDNG